MSVIQQSAQIYLGYTVVWDSLTV